MSRPREPYVASKTQYCDVCADTTEWRLNKVGFTKNRIQRTRWRCVECRNRKARHQ